MDVAVRRKIAWTLKIVLPLITTRMTGITWVAQHVKIEIIFPFQLNFKALFPKVERRSYFVDKDDRADRTDRADEADVAEKTDGAHEKHGSERATGQKKWNVKSMRKTVWIS